MNPLRLGIIFTSKATVSRLAFLIEQIERACRQSPAFSAVQCVGMSGDGAHQVSLMGGLVKPTSAYPPAGSVDVVVVVGDDESPLSPQVDERTLNYLARLATTTVPLVGIGSGTLVLCKAGVMANRRLCVSWKLQRGLSAAFPQVSLVHDRVFVVDGARITCVGNSGVTHLASYLVQMHSGRAIAHTRHLAATLDIDCEVDGFASAKVAEDPRLGRCLRLIEENFSQPRPLRLICFEMSMSCRALERLFQRSIGMSPTEVFKRLRMRHALWLIENTDRRVLDVALESGFSSGAHFARTFKRFYGQTPVARRALRRDEVRVRSMEHPVEHRYSMLREALAAVSTDTR